MKRNMVMSISWRLMPSECTEKNTPDAIKMAPVPRVVAFVGPCSRMKKSGSFAKATDPRRINRAPRSKAIARKISSISVIVFLLYNVATQKVFTECDCANESHDCDQ